MINFNSYLINLDRAPERLAWSIRQFNLLSLGFTRIQAVDMHDFNASSSTLVTSGVQACWESHIKVLQNFLQSDFEYAFVFEDDFQVEKIDKVVGVLGAEWLSEWDIVQIGYVSPGYQNKLRIKLSNIEHSFFHLIAICMNSFNFSSKLKSRMRIKSAAQSPSGWVPASFEPGTHCYLISRRAASIVLTLNNPQFLSADDFYSALARMRSLKFLRPYRSLVSQHNFPKFEGPRFTQQ